MALRVEQPNGPGSIRRLLFGDGHGMGWPAARRDASSTAVLPVKIPEAHSTMPG